MRFEHLSIGHTGVAGDSGLSVLLFSEQVPCAYYPCGSAPGTRDVVPLTLGNAVERIDALVFTGGSAYGLGASTGVMEYLAERGRGLATPGRTVPIVPAACIFDLAVGEPVYPTADDAYRACRMATLGDYVRGRVGVGTGASVGKGLQDGRPMTGGFGIGSVQAGAVQVLACAAVNALGDVVDRGRIVAGAVDGQGRFLDTERHVLENSPALRTSLTQSNTTLMAVICNAALGQQELSMVAKMASAGCARAVAPAFSPWDGDIVFGASAGDLAADVTLVGALGAEAVRLAILDAVREATVIG